ncbi:tubulin polyglutamylase complex subunit 1 [Paramormyrops kingsleyae]|uniref:Tubulin polyglutamylase complex subunit 1 n=1 Tax=Paramormyrops kingsleyae TaxID=1676925 RepID=A0A3B3S9B5_9TELE|nr:tubulin polyglutamylase complex subunit 1 [Paramormyrops kingsleyae]
MAEKRRSGVSMAEPKIAKADSEEEFLSQLGVAALLRGSLLKLVEARPEDPIGFLADHFANLASGSEAADCGDAEPSRTVQDRLSQALWNLNLAHHSQRSAFNNNVRVAYELLMTGGQHLCPGGGVRGRIYTELLRSLCTEAGLSSSTSAPLLRRIQCQDHEAVPFELFRQGVLICTVFADYVRKSQSLYLAVCGGSEVPAQRALCQAALGALRDALDTTQCADTARYLEASAKIAPCTLAQAMVSAQSSYEAQAGASMDPEEFEKEAVALFTARIQPVS